MNKCIICDKEIKKIKSLGLQPLANKYPKSKYEIEDEFTSLMDVHYCENCLYVNLPCKVGREIFFEDYYYLSSVNKELVDHFESLATVVYELGSKFVLDVGSNDGILLEKLLDKNIKCIGIDPSENVSAIANKKGLKTIVGFFNEKSVDEIKKSFGNPDLITASSVFTHFENPGLFFKNCKNLLNKNGKVIIEVEYLADIVNDFAFERFYFDRPHYYSLNALIKLAELYDFKIEDAELINVHGGSIRVIFTDGINVKTSERVKEILKKEKSYLSKNQLIDKFDLFSSSCKKLKDQIISFKNKNVTLAAYGCPARFSTITNFAGITKEDIPFVIDDSRLKQGRLSPGKHIPIYSFNKNNNIDIYIVFAYEYIKSIKKQVENPNVKFYKPIPFQKI